MQKDNDEAMLKAVLVLVFMLVALGFTAYQTATGYESAIETVPAWALAFLCAGILGLLTLALKTNLKNGTNSTGIWIGCVIIAGVSFAGNFNSFYTGFIKNELIKDELEAKRSALDEIYTRSETVLAEKAFIQFQRDLESLQKQLTAQIVNEGNPGLGPEARKVIKLIEAKLGETLTPQSAASNTTESLLNLSKRYEASIKEKVEGKRIGLVENATERLKAQVENKARYDGAIKLVDASLSALASSKSKAVVADAVQAIQEAVAAYSRIGAQTKASLPQNIAFTYETKLTLESDKIGSIDFSFNSAVKHLGHFAVWLSAFLAFFIDMGVPLVIWLIHGRGDISVTGAVTVARDRRNKPNII